MSNVNRFGAVSFPCDIQAKRSSSAKKNALHMQQTKLDFLTIARELGLVRAQVLSEDGEIVLPTSGVRRQNTRGRDLVVASNQEALSFLSRSGILDADTIADRDLDDPSRPV